MRYAILADIHGNLEAFQAVLAVLKKRTIDKFICLGDIVGYGADPAKCIKIVRELGAETVMGNHDDAVIGRTDIRYFNSYAAEAVIWTQRRLGYSEKNFLESLKLVKDFPDFTIVHAALHEPQNWTYILDIQDAQKSFNLLKTNLLFVGHSHLPAIFEETSAGKKLTNKQYRGFFQPAVNLEENNRYIVNAGSIGQPRDGDPRACAVIYDSETRQIRFLRVPYDVETTARKIIKAGLPEWLAARLSEGR